jgi:non-homologous end joining protein Ku
VKDLRGIIRRKENGERMYISQNKRDFNKAYFIIPTLKSDKAYLVISNEPEQCKMTGVFWVEIYWDL